MKHIFQIIFIILVASLFFVSADEFSGDGVHTLKKGDIVTLDNGWKVEIVGIFIAHAGEQISYRLQDQEGNNYTEVLNKYEGKKKLGTDTVLKVQIEIKRVSGQKYPTGSPLVTEYELVELEVFSIDEALPGIVGLPEDFEEIDKELTYKNGERKTMGIGDKISLANGYLLKLDSFGRFGPSFSIYDENNNLIDKDLQVGKGVGAFIGSYVHLNDFSETSLDLTIINGSKIIFGTGWNLFSIPVEDGDGFGTVLESTCNRAVVWVWDSGRQTYGAIGVLEEGTKLPAGKGMLVKIQTKRNTVSDEDCEILVSGKNSVSLEGMLMKKGWNLIGAPIKSYGTREIYDGGSDFNLLDFNDILGSCKIEKGPWQYLATKLVQVGQGADVADTNKFSQPFNNKLRMNRGYFIKVEEDCVLASKTCNIFRSQCDMIVSNGNTQDKLDLVFVAINYSDPQTFYDDVNTALFLNDPNNDWNRGLFVIEPFKSNQDKFNVHIIRDVCLKNEENIIPKVLSSQCSDVDEIIALVDDPVGIQRILDTGSGSVLAGHAYADYFLKYPETIGAAIIGRYNVAYGLAYTVTHEFGHSFGLLCDEYIIAGNFPGELIDENVECPNCAAEYSGDPNAPCPKWSDVSGAGCYLGCGFPDLYRSSKHSIMGAGELGSLIAEFNEVSRVALNNKLRRFS